MTTESLSKEYKDFFLLTGISKTEREAEILARGEVVKRILEAVGKGIVPIESISESKGKYVAKLNLTGITNL